MAQLLLTPRITCLRSAQLSLQTYIIPQRRRLFCTIDHTQNSHRGLIFPQLLSQVVMTRDRSCIPQVREQALWPPHRNPTCFFLPASCRQLQYRIRGSSVRFLIYCQFKKEIHKRDGKLRGRNRTEIRSTQSEASTKTCSCWVQSKKSVELKNVSSMQQHLPIKSSPLQLYQIYKPQSPLIIAIHSTKCCESTIESFRVEDVTK